MPNDNVLTDIVRRDIEHALRWIQPANPAHRILTALLDLHPGQPEPVASPGVIAAALAVIEADRSQTLTNEHVDALDIAIKIQRGMFKPPEPRAEVTHGDTTMGEYMASLLDRLETAEVYADRYRYLRERPQDAVGAGGVFAGKTPDNVVLNGADLDAAIDAARAGAGHA